MGYPVYSGYFGAMIWPLSLASSDIVPGNWLYLDGLLDETIEQFPSLVGRASIETERELVKVVVEMIFPNSALVGSQQPSFEESGDSVDTRQKLVGQFLAPADICDLVFIAVAAQIDVPFPPVGVNDRSRLNRFLNEWQQAALRDVIDSPQANAAHSSTVFFHRDRHNELVFDLPSMQALFFAAQIGLIDFNASRQPITARPHHSATKFVEPCPDGLIPFKSEFPLESKGADSVFFAGDQPHREKPQPQGLPGTFENRSRRCRSLVVATRAFPQSQPARRPRSRSTACRTTKALGPANLLQVRPTRDVRAKTLTEFNEVSRIVFDFNHATASSRLTPLPERVATLAT